MVRQTYRNPPLLPGLGTGYVETLPVNTDDSRWFGHVQQRPPEAPVRSGVLKHVDKVKRGRGRPKLTWDESVKRDLKDWNISEDLVLDRNAWRLAINVPEP